MSVFGPGYILSLEGGVFWQLACKRYSRKEKFSKTNPPEVPVAARTEVYTPPPRAAPISSLSPSLFLSLSLSHSLLLFLSFSLSLTLSLFLSLTLLLYLSHSFSHSFSLSHSLTLLKKTPWQNNKQFVNNRDT
eukprot:sb/3474869/